MLGVKVAVQVRPSLLVEGAEILPPSTVTSAAVNPTTASEKVKVTGVVSPAVRAASVMAIATVGLWVSVPDTHLRAHETKADFVCRLLLAKQKPERLPCEDWSAG